MHKFIILGDDVYTLDTVGERQHAAWHMLGARVRRLPVFRGNADKSELNGLYFGDDGLFHEQES